MRGRKVVKKYCAYPKPFKDEVCKIYLESNKNITSLAKDIGIDRLTLTKWIEERGIFENDFTRLRKFNHSEIIKDIESGMIGVKIAKKHGCSESLVSALRNGRR